MLIACTILFEEHNFSVFADKSSTMKIVPCKNLVYIRVHVYMVGNVWCCLGATFSDYSPLLYFSKANTDEKLLDPQGVLAGDLPLSMTSVNKDSLPVVLVCMVPMHHHLTAGPLFAISTCFYTICSFKIFKISMLQVRQRVNGYTS